MRTGGIEVLKLLEDKTRNQIIFYAVEKKGVLSVVRLTNSSRKKLKIGLFKIFEKLFLRTLTAIKFNSFQQKSINTLRYDPKGGKGYLTCIVNQ